MVLFAVMYQGNNPSVGHENFHSTLNSMSSSSLDPKNSPGFQSFNPPWDSSPSLGSGFIGAGSTPNLNPPPALSLPGPNTMFHGINGSLSMVDSGSMTGASSNVSLEVLSEDAFPVVGWLRKFGMCMYRWSADVNDWSQVALHVRQDVVAFVVGQDGSGLVDLYKHSNCQVTLERQILQGLQENFLVFNRGPQGHPLNQNMMYALQIVGDRIRSFLHQQVN